jgi:hypothetical protein
MLENAIESRDEKIYKLEKELERFEDEVIVSSKPACEKCESEDKTLNDMKEHDPSEHIDSDMPSTSKCGKCEYESDDEAEMKMHTKSDHIEKCESVTCDHCNFTSKDEWKHITHICKVHIVNPTFEDLYT